MTSPTHTDPRSTAAVLRRAAEAGLWLPASGASMGVAIQGGDVLHILARPGGRRARPGEVWLGILPDGHLVAHRVVRAAPDLVHLAGDAAGRVDPPLPPELLVGRVVSVRRAGREVKLRRRSLAGRQLDRLRRARRRG